MTTQTNETTADSRSTRYDLRDCKTTSDVLAKANLSYRVRLAPAYYINTVTGKQEKIETGHQSVIREDTGEAIAVVGSRYCPIQTTDFLEALNPVVESGLLKFVSALSVDNGRSVVVEAQLPEPIVLKAPNGKEDVLLRRVLYRNTYDGTRPQALQDYLLRQWCKNGATHMLGMTSHIIRHTASAEGKFGQVLKAVDASLKRFETVATNAKMLSAAPFTIKQMTEVADRLFPTAPGKEPTTRTEKARAALVELFHNGQGTFGKTAWDALNAVTEWNTHQRPVRGDANKDVARLRSLWDGLDQSRPGYDAVCDLAGVKQVDAA